MEPIAIWLLAASVLVLGVGYLVYLYLRENVVNAGGKGADKRMGRVLSRYALPRRFRVLRDLRLEARDGEITVEQLMIGFFGILLVHTIGARGEFYGKLTDKEWVLVRDGRRTAFPNPYLEQQKAISAIRPVLSRHKMHNVPFHHVVIFTNTSKKTAVFIAPDESILLRGKLKPYLARTRFDHDAEIDVEQVVSFLEAYTQKK